MSEPVLELPYRRNVGAVIFNREGKVFIARRTDMEGAGGPLSGGVWQCPQGGIDDDESPEIAVLREVHEETGLTEVAILGSHPEWLSYEFPASLSGTVLGGKFRGQTQKWFALRYLGDDAAINLENQSPPEFDAWRWANIQELDECNVGFKKPIYAALVRDFAIYARAA